MPTWGERLRQMRTSVLLSRDGLASQVVRICADLAESRPDILRQLRIAYPEDFSPSLIAKFETDQRVPVDRETHLLLLLTLSKLGAVARRADADCWLDSGGQGWLSDRENAVLSLRP